MDRLLIHEMERYLSIANIYIWQSSLALCKLESNFLNMHRCIVEIML